MGSRYNSPRSTGRGINHPTNQAVTKTLQGSNHCIDQVPTRSKGSVPPKSNPATMSTTIVEPNTAPLTLPNCHSFARTRTVGSSIATAAPHASSALAAKNKAP